MFILYVHVNAGGATIKTRAHEKHMYFYIYPHLCAFIHKSKHACVSFKILVFMEGACLSVCVCVCVCVCVVGVPLFQDCSIYRCIEYAF